MAKAGDVFFRMDLRCSGRIPLGPAADPFGKERAAEKTSDEVKTLADMVETGGGGWTLLGGGCSAAFPQDWQENIPRGHVKSAPALP